MVSSGYNTAFLLSLLVCHILASAFHPGGACILRLANPVPRPLRVCTFYWIFWTCGWKCTIIITMILPGLVASLSPGLKHSWDNDFLNQVLCLIWKRKELSAHPYSTKRGFYVPGTAYAIYPWRRKREIKNRTWQILVMWLNTVLKGAQISMVMTTI